MKKLIITTLFLVAISYNGKSQSIYVYASEKIKGAEIPIERVDFEVIVNDSIKKKFTSQNDGSLGRISVPKGKYKVKLTTEEFADGINEEVIVNEFKTTSLVVNLLRLTPAQIEEKKKAGKK
jgi:hypothetical protein